MSDTLANLTEYQELALRGGHNLSDGHARHGQHLGAVRIWERLSEIYSIAEHTPQREVELRFLSHFFRLAGQSVDVEQVLLSYSASTVIETIAHYLGRRSMSVALIHPAFDNIPAVMRRANIQLRPLDDAILHGDQLYHTIVNVAESAIFLVCPNNPTGWCPSQVEFRAIVDACRDAKKLLLLDFSFRFFSPLIRWDQYTIMHDSGIDFIAVEDTGKTWPTLDLKVGMCLGSGSVRDELHHVYTDVLLNVSAFTLELLSHHIMADMAEGIERHLGTIARANRAALRFAVEGTGVQLLGTEYLGTEWLQLPPNVTSDQAWVALSGAGVHVLPGDRFFWADQTLGRSFIRVALMRPPEMFAAAMIPLSEALRRICAGYRGS